MELSFLILFSIFIIVPIVVNGIHLFLSNLKDNKKLNNKILQKFNNYLIEQCRKENIKIEFKTLKELNKNNSDKNKSTVGLYVCTRHYVYNNMPKLETFLFDNKMSSYGTYKSKDYLNYGYNKTLKYGNYNKIEKQLPDEIIFDTTNSVIQLTKDYDIFTLAHELGHHFSIKNNKDKSEKSADNYINTLSNECLEYWERYCINISLSTHSNIDIKYNYFKVLKQYLKYKLLINTKS